MVLVAIGWMLLRPGGLIGGSLRDWNARRQTVASLHDQWPKLAGGESRLDSGAAIVALVEFADYQCPYCRVQHAALSSLLRAKPRVGVVYRHFPLSSHLAARGAALAAICAEEQGRFRAMHARLLETNNWASDANWIREAEVVGIPDRIRFQSCLDSPRSRSRLEADVTLGRAMSVTGTPAFVTRHGVFVGVQSEAELLRLVAPE
jgi:protein-disulfide isomerase